MFSKYFERGLSVIPVNRSGKNPISMEWQKYCSALPSEKEIEAWERLWATGINIGIALGSASNLVCLDIDVDDPIVLSLCPLSPVVKRGAKGESRFFRYTPGFESRSFPGLDLLGPGRQTILPPSIHSETKKPYVWLTPDTLENYCVSDLPELDLSFLDRVLPLLKASPINHASGRNNKLRDIVTSMRGRGEPEARIVREVYEWDRQYHDPRLFTDQKEQYRAKTEDEAKASAWLFVSSVTRSLINAGVAILEEEIKILEPSEAATSDNRHVHRPYPAPRGIMKLFVEYCELTSKGNQDALGLGGAIILLAGMCSNRFRTEVRGLPVWPNVNVLNLGYSSFGKDTSQRLIDDLLCDSGIIGSAGYKSGTSIVQDLPEQQERVDLIDEASWFLKSMHHGEHYQSEIVEILSTLFSRSSGRFNGISSAGHGSRFGACYNPCVSILASTTPMGFKESVNKAMAAKGLMPRFLTFYQKDVGDYRGMNNHEEAARVKSELKREVDSILSIEKPVMSGSKRNLVQKDMGSAYDPILVPMSEDAQKRWIAYERDIHYKAADRPDEFESAFVGRFAELSAKLSLLDAISLGAREISISSLEWAIGVIETQWNNAQPLYELATAENLTEANYIRVINIIANKCAPMSLTEIYNKTRWLTAKQRSEILTSGLDAGDLLKRESPDKSANGKPKTLYLINRSKS